MEVIRYRFPMQEIQIQLGQINATPDCRYYIVRLENGRMGVIPNDMSVTYWIAFAIKLQVILHIQIVCSKLEGRDRIWWLRTESNSESEPPKGATSVTIQCETISTVYKLGFGWNWWRERGMNCKLNFALCRHYTNHPADLRFVLECHVSTSYLLI